MYYKLFKLGPYILYCQYLGSVGVVPLGKISFEIQLWPLLLKGVIADCPSCWFFAPYVKAVSAPCPWKNLDQMEEKDQPRRHLHPPLAPLHQRSIRVSVMLNILQFYYSWFWINIVLPPFRYSLCTSSGRNRVQGRSPPMLLLPETTTGNDYHTGIVLVCLLCQSKLAGTIHISSADLQDFTPCSNLLMMKKIFREVVHLPQNLLVPLPRRSGEPRQSQSKS